MKHEYITYSDLKGFTLESFSVSPTKAVAVFKHKKRPEVMINLKCGRRLKTLSVLYPANISVMHAALRDLETFTQKLADSLERKSKRMQNE